MRFHLRRLDTMTMSFGVNLLLADLALHAGHKTRLPETSDGRGASHGTGDSSYLSDHLVTCTRHLFLTTPTTPFQLDDPLLHALQPSDSLRFESLPCTVLPAPRARHWKKPAQFTLHRPLPCPRFLSSMCSSCPDSLICLSTTSCIGIPVCQGFTRSGELRSGFALSLFLVLNSWCYTRRSLTTVLNSCILSLNTNASIFYHF